MKTQMKCQKKLCLILLILAALSFVVALGYETGVLYGFGTTLSSNATSDPKVNSKFAAGGQLYIDSYEFNQMLMILGIVLILAVVCLYITATNSRRNYYISNYVVSILVIAIFIGISVYVMVNNASYLSRVYEVLADEEAMEWYANRASILSTCKYSENIFMFIATFVVYALDILGAIALALNLVWKHKLMKGEKELLDGESIAKEVV